MKLRTQEGGPVIKAGFIGLGYLGEQLLLPLNHSVDSLKSCFQGSTGKKVALKLTDNSTSMVSVRETGEVISVRLHRIFLGAGDDVVREIASFIKKRKGRMPLLKSFIKQNVDRLKKLPPRKATVNPKGKYHSLNEIFGFLNRTYFEDRISCLITWGTKSPRYAVKKRILGSYIRHTNTIRINPVLDKRTVPGYYIEFVVYHEMLHADLDVPERNGRRLVHSKEFKEREKLFEHYGKAIAWEKRKGF